MKKVWARIGSMVLVCAMLCTLFSVGALADNVSVSTAEELETAVQNPENEGNTIVIDADINITETIEITQAVTVTSAEGVVVSGCIDDSTAPLFYLNYTGASIEG